MTHSFPTLILDCKKSLYKLDVKDLVCDIRIRPAALVVTLVAQICIYLDGS